MTTVTLELDAERKRFDLEDGPTHVHAGETVMLVVKGLGITAEEANGTNLLDNAVPEDESGSDADVAAAYPSLRARLLHPVYGDLAMYPWPGTGAHWGEIDEARPGAGLACQLDLDTEQLFRVVRSGHGAETVLYVERPWPETVPTVYGTYALRVEDWPEATGETRVFPTSGRYAYAFGGVLSVSLQKNATLSQTIDAVNAVLGALKTLAQRTGEEE